MAQTLDTYIDELKQIAAIHGAAIEVQDRSATHLDEDEGETAYQVVLIWRENNHSDKPDAVFELSEYEDDGDGEGPWYNTQYRFDDNTGSVRSLSNHLLVDLASHLRQ